MPSKTFMVNPVYRIISAAWLVFASIHAIASPDAGAPQPASLFTDHMVLQRDTPVKIWGLAQPADSVGVEFGGQSVTSTADADGRWTAVLKPLTASAASRELTVQSAKTGQKTVLTDVLVGDVWLCSGQSNMQWSVSQSTDGPAVLQTCDQPLIRGFVVNSDSSAEPRDKVVGTWNVCAPAKGDQPSPVASWSGVAYFFGARLHAETGVPVGLVMASVGGTAIESWMSPEALEKSGLGPEVKSRWQSLLENLPAKEAEFREAHAAWEKEQAAAQSEGRQPQGKRPRPPAGPGSQFQPSALWNAMILPLVPFQWAGILWYQAEANSSRYLEYPALQASLIENWRKAFDQPDLPFYFFQLPGYARSPGAGAGPGLAFIREAQQTSLTLPHTGMAVTVDLAVGDDLHPPNKKDFGERMADIVLADSGKKPGPVGGPGFSKATPGKNNMLVEFEGQPELVLKDPDSPRAFLLAGEDRVFHPATAQLDGRTLVVTSPAVPQPVAVRYAWFAAPQAVLFGKNGWPAAPFRSDNWKTGEFKYP